MNQQAQLSLSSIRMEERAGLPTIGLAKVGERRHSLHRFMEREWHEKSQRVTKRRRREEEARWKKPLV